MHDLRELQALDPDALMERAREARLGMSQSEWAMGNCLLAFERREVHRLHGFSSVVRFADLKFALDAPKAAELLRTARALECLPLLSKSYRVGEICWTKIRALTRVVCPLTEVLWVDYARTHTCAEVQSQVTMNPRDFKLRAAEQAAAHRRNSQATNPFKTGACDSAAASASLRPSPALVDESVIPEAVSGPQGGLAREAGPQGEPQVMPLPVPMPGPKFVTVTLVFTTDEFAEWDQGEQQARSVLGKRVRRELAALQMVRQSLAGASARARARHQVVILVNAEDGQAHYQTSRGVLRASPEVVAQAMESGPAMVHGPPRPAQGRTIVEQPDARKKGKRPPIPMAVLKALFIRAGGRCEIPGCGCPGPLHTHHIKPWSEGGDHRLDNVALLCAACHGLEHVKDYAEKPDWVAARTRRRGRSTSG